MRTEHPNDKQIIKALEGITRRGHDFHRVFSDFLALSCHSLCKNEEAYMEIIRRYADNHARGERNADYFAEAFAAWLNAMRTETRDYLGDIFQERVTRGANGQYFTPESLCQMMAQMTSPNLAAGERVNDPACGSGRTLLAAADINARAIFRGGDIDINCVRMAALNLLCRNITGTIVHGNALTLEAMGGYQLQHTHEGGALFELTKEEARTIMEAPLKGKENELTEREREAGEQMDMGL